MSVYTEAAPMFAPIDDFDDEPMLELPATLSQAWFNDVIDADAVDMLEYLIEQEERPLCPSSEKPFIPSALDVLEGRAQVVADTYTFAQDANEVRVINPATESAYSITKLVGEAPVCSCPAFKHSGSQKVCKHLLSLCIRGIDIPEQAPARRLDIKPLKAREAAMAAPRPYVEIAAADW